MRQFIPTIALALTVGYGTGRFVTLLLLPAALPLTVTSGPVKPEVSIIELTEVQEHDVVGTVAGNARVFAAGEPVMPDENGQIRFPIEPFLKSYIEVITPDGAKFVASKKGTRYYPVDSASANNLKPANRVYFDSAEEAEAAGYEK